MSKSSRIQRLDDELEKSLRGNGKSYETLWELCHLGTRFPGTPGESPAREFVVSELKGRGFAVAEEPFEHLGWKRGPTVVEVLDPLRQEFDAFALAGCPATPDSGIEAELVDVGDGSPVEFEALRSEIEGKVVLSSSLSPSKRCVPKGQCHRRTKYGRAVAGGAAAFLFSNSQPGMLSQAGSLRQNRLGEIPAVALSYEQGEFLRHLLRNGAARSGNPAVKARVSTRCETLTNRSANITAELPGKSSDQVVLIAAHYDCHDNSPGALDNASGVISLLEIARVLADSDVELEKTVRFVFTGVEELACVGSSFYVIDHSEELDNIHLMINVDSPASPGGKTFDTGGFEDTERFVRSAGEEMGYPMAQTPPAFGADALPFIYCGVPTASLTRDPGSATEDRGWGHTSADTPDKITPADLVSSALLIGKFLVRAAEHSGPIAPRRSKDEVRSLLAHHGMDEVLRFMQWPTLPLRQ
jgi:Zn-dependent M28 family amino/carboxypeptidase